MYIEQRIPFLFMHRKHIRGKTLLRVVFFNFPAVNFNSLVLFLIFFFYETGFQKLKLMRILKNSSKRYSKIHRNLNSNCYRIYSQFNQKTTQKHEGGFISKTFLKNITKVYSALYTMYLYM